MNVKIKLSTDLITIHQLNDSSSSILINDNDQQQQQPQEELIDSLMGKSLYLSISTDLSKSTQTAFSLQDDNEEVDNNSMSIIQKPMVFKIQFKFINDWFINDVDCQNKYNCINKQPSKGGNAVEIDCCTGDLQNFTFSNMNTKVIFVSYRIVLARYSIYYSIQ